MADLTEETRLDGIHPGTRKSEAAKSHHNEDPLAKVLEWDWGTAYELLFSFHTIMRPKEHGIPAPWSAGVRKRLSQQSQADLKLFFSFPFSYFTRTPLHLVHSMDQPKNVDRFIELLEGIPDQQFSERIHLPLVDDAGLARITNKAVSGKRLTDIDVEEYRRIISKSGNRSAPTVADVRRLLTDMGDPVGLKQRYISLLREYQAVYFAEEEKRVGPALKKMLTDAQALSKTTTVSDMIERLSNGFTLSEDIDLKKLILIPSIWSHPFVVRFDPADRELFLAWGARPAGYRLVPGESVPDDALLVLRALGDPTRLRLLRLLAVEPRSPQSLAIELKLSLPTVSHHIRELRISGLIRIEMAGKGRESKYTVRWPSAKRAFQQLEEFVLRSNEP